MAFVREGCDCSVEGPPAVVATVQRPGIGLAVAFGAYTAMPGEKLISSNVSRPPESCVESQGAHRVSIVRSPRCTWALSVRRQPKTESTLSQVSLPLAITPAPL